MFKAAAASFIVASLLVMAGCGNQSSLTSTSISAPSGTSSTPPSNPSVVTAPVGLAVTDAPPNGVTVLFFQLSITGATLTPGNVPLLSGPNPIPVNVSQLQTEVDFLGNANVAAGTYTGLTVTFANPQLTIYNGSGAAIGTCANNSICQLTPTASPSTLTFSSAPFPITLTTNSPLAFTLDIHLDTVIQPNLTVDLSAPSGVTLSQLPSPPGEEPFPALGELRGTVQSVGTDQFTLQSYFGRTFTILANDSTTYSFPSNVCPADAFSCLGQGQLVKVTVSLQPDGSLLATSVDYLQAAGQKTVEGTIVDLSTSSGTTMMDLILQHEPFGSMSNTLPLGGYAQVTVPASGVTYAVDSNGFSIPSGLSFASASDLQEGQEVQVVVEGAVTTSSGWNSGSHSTPFGHAGLAFATDSIELLPSQITGTVAAIDLSSLNFTLSTFPGLFLPRAANAGGPPNWAPVEITIQTTAATTFTNFTSDTLSGLAKDDMVSVGGWVFSTPSGATSTTVAADAVQLSTWPLF